MSNNIILTDTQKNWLEQRDITETLWNVLTTSIFVGAKPESILMAVEYCKARGLDIMKKPCHIVPMYVKDSKTNNSEYRDIIMPSITEQRITAARTGEYAGQDAPVFGEMIEMKFGKAVHIVPEYCTITVYRIVHGIKVPFTHTEYFDEICATKKDGDLNAMWSKRKRGQLAKCAEAGALRKAFPEEVGNEYTVEEMQGKVLNVGGSEEVDITPQASITMDVSNDPTLFSNLKQGIASGNVDKVAVLNGDAGYVLSDSQRQELMTA